MVSGFPCRPCLRGERADGRQRAGRQDHGVGAGIHIPEGDGRVQGPETQLYRQSGINRNVIVVLTAGPA